MTAATPNFRITTRLVAGLVLPFALALAGVAASTAGSATTHSASTADAQGTAIVRARPGRERAAEALVAKLGGTVHTRLKIIGGFSATLPAGAVSALRRSGDVLSLTANQALRPQSSNYSAAYDPASDGYSMSQVTQLTGARAWWSAGYTGKGVDVALIDSGVSPVLGLSGAGNLINWTRPLPRVPGAEPALPRHLRTRHVHGRTHCRPRRGSECRCSSLGISRDRP